MIIPKKSHVERREKTSIGYDPQSNAFDMVFAPSQPVPRPFALRTETFVL